MGTRRQLAVVTQNEALSFFHGSVMKTEANLAPILKLFPTMSLKEADGKWCAAFVYYCCIKAGFSFPIKPHESCSNHLAGCNAWEEWALADDKLGYFTAKDNIQVEPGDIVIYDRVFEDKEHDHMGIVVENKTESIRVAEGNINNVSGVIERKKDLHIRGYIRLPNL